MQKTMDHELFQQLITQAKKSPRRRAHYNLHNSFEEPVQRVCIGLLKGTYVRPHAHTQTGKWELILALRGRTCLILFDRHGCITERHLLSESANLAGIELAPGTWHTLFPMDSESLILEIKQGPYDPATASCFAEWSPEEGEEATNRFLPWLEQAEVGASFS